jgi:phosphatidylglycerol:prolipoprotein diacylglycerol transferase
MLTLGPFSVPYYTAVLDAGLLLGVALACFAAQRRRFDVTHVLNVALVAAMGGVLCARVVYLAAHWGYYHDHLPQALRLTDGGLAWHGGLAGGLAGTWAYCSVLRVSLRSVLDALTPGVALLAICGWLGCLAANCAYGIETYPGQGILWSLSLELPDLYSIRVPRVAVQLLGAGWGAIGLIASAALTRCIRFDGFVFFAWLTLYSAGSFGLGFMRADETLRVASWRAGQLVDLVLVAMGLSALVVGLFWKRQMGRAV